jgi:hypothetical protein
LIFDEVYEDFQSNLPLECFSHDGWYAHGNNATVLFSNFSYLWATYKQARAQFS